MSLNNYFQFCLTEIFLELILSILLSFSLIIYLLFVKSTILAIVLLKEKFQMYHFIGAGFIVTGIYLSNRKNQ